MSLVANADILAVLIYILAVVVFYHSYKFRGLNKTLLLFFGFLVVGGCIENINIIFGGYYYPPSPLTFFIYRCPLWVWLGWWLIAYCGSIMAHKLIGGGRGSLPIIGVGTALEKGVDKQFIKDTILRSLLAAYLSMLIGLIMDPVAATNGWWIWQVDNIYLHGVPAGNYFGWGMVVFWTFFFYDIIMVWSHSKGKNEKVTAGVWAGASVIALLLAGLLLMSCTFAFGIDGIRTDDRTPLMDMILTVDWGEMMIAMVMVLISMGLIILSSFAPNKLPEPRPKEKIWYILPPILLIIYWATMLVAAFLTNSLMVVNGIVSCLPLLLLCGYIIKNPYMEK